MLRKSTIWVSPPRLSVPFCRNQCAQFLFPRRRNWGCTTFRKSWQVNRGWDDHRGSGQIPWLYRRVAARRASLRHWPVRRNVVGHWPRRHQTILWASRWPKFRFDLQIRIHRNTFCREGPQHICWSSRSPWLPSPDHWQNFRKRSIRCLPFVCFFLWL